MTRIALAIALMSAAVPAMASPALYRFDTVHSQVLFSVSHNGFSQPQGRMHLAGGWLSVDPDDPTTASTALDIDLASVDMGDADWNRAVRGPKLLDAGADRYAHFAGTSVDMTGPRQGVLHGTLTLRGHAQPVDVAFTLNRHGVTVFGMHDTIGVSASATLDRRAFGMISNPGSIGSQVNVRLEIEAVEDTQARDRYQAHGSPAHAATQ